MAELDNAELCNIVSALVKDAEEDCLGSTKRLNVL